MAKEYVPVFIQGDEVTCTASAAITGGQLVELTGPYAVAPAAATSESWFGVAGFDAAAGDDVTIYRQQVQRPIASGAVTAGDAVIAAADGKVATSATPTVLTHVGTALSTAADGETVEVAFTR